MPNVYERLAGIVGTTFGFARGLGQLAWTPTAPRTISFPDASGTVALVGGASPVSRVQTADLLLPSNTSLVVAGPYTINGCTLTIDSGAVLVVT